MILRNPVIFIKYYWYNIFIWKFIICFEAIGWRSLICFLNFKSDSIRYISHLEDTRAYYFQISVSLQPT